MPSDNQRPYYNCHTHIFTGQHVPRHLGKRLLPFPFGFISIHFILKVVAPFFEYESSVNKILRSLFKVQKEVEYFFYYRPLLKIVVKLTVFDIFLLAVTIFFDILFKELGLKVRLFDKFYKQLSSLLPKKIFNQPVNILILIAAIFLSQRFRNLLTKFFNTVFGPGPRTREYLGRIIAMARYPAYSSEKSKFKQSTILERLIRLYPSSTKFVVLPMDMEYMGAGNPAPRYSYLDQISDLKSMVRGDYKFKDQIIPFIAADPRRIRSSPKYLGEIKDYLNTDFKGIKIYPALGYYPFDEHLLELFLFASEREIPIMTHCMKGVVYYRGRKKKDWNYHPIFNFREDRVTKSLYLPEFRNQNFTANFTHPLNYICLLDKKFLGKVLEYYDNSRLNELFEYTPGRNESPKNDLSNLKICFGHFGGNEEWDRYIKNDRNIFENQYLNDSIRNSQLKKPFLVRNGDIRQLWFHTSWYAIVYDIMLQYPNVYADISYIVHDNDIFSMIKALREIDHIKERLLFGTDFYLVRQRETEKQIWTQLKGSLNTRDFSQLTQLNPEAYLNIK